MCMNVLPAFMSVYHVCLMPKETRLGFGFMTVVNRFVSAGTISSRSSGRVFFSC